MLPFSTDCLRSKLNEVWKGCLSTVGPVCHPNGSVKHKGIGFCRLWPSKPRGFWSAHGVTDHHVTPSHLNIRISTILTIGSPVNTLSSFTDFLDSPTFFLVFSFRSDFDSRPSANGAMRSSTTARGHEKQQTITWKSTLVSQGLILVDYGHWQSPCTFLTHTNH